MDWYLPGVSELHLAGPLFIALRRGLTPASARSPPIRVSQYEVFEHISTYTNRPMIPLARSPGRCRRLPELIAITTAAK